MGHLSPALLRSRLALDYRVVAGAKPCESVTITAYASHEALLKGRPVSPEEGEAGHARFYRADFHFPMLTGPGTTTQKPVIAVFDISLASYPFTAPLATIVSRPLPWSPHVHPSSGILCTGNLWQASRGRLLLLQFVGHTMRFLNTDEPDHDPYYVGWNGAAVRYWRTQLNRKPLNPGLAYPVVPVELIHGDVHRPVASDLFQPVEDDDVFAPI